MLAILRRELESYFYTTIAYIFIGVFLSLSSLIFGLQNLSLLSSDIPSFLAQISLIMLFIIPILSMRMFCKEFSEGTNKLLFSNPIKISGIVLGKFLAAGVIIVVATGLSLVYPFIISVYGKLYLPETILAYLGFILFSLSLLALDMFIATFAKNQISSVVMAFGINLTLWLADIVSKNINSVFSEFLSSISIYKRLESFMIGQLSISGICFFISTIIIFIIASIYRLNRIVYGGLRR